MGDLKASFKDPSVIEITSEAEGASWTFYVTKDRSGRRHLDGPHGTAEAMAYGNLMQRACSLAQSEALHSGKVDY